MRFSTPGVILIVLGVLLLMRNFGWFDIDLMPLLRTWWPLLLVIVGVGMIVDRRRGRP